MAQQIRLDRSERARMTKKERRAFDREVARLERERQARARKRRKALGWTGAGIGVLAALAVVALIVVTNIREGERGPANMLSDGLLLQGSSDTQTISAVTTAALEPGDSVRRHTNDVASSGVLDLQIYFDPTAKASAVFWQTDGASLRTYLSSGSILLELHPVARATTDADAIAAVAALGCVANGAPESMLDVIDALMKAGSDGTAIATTAHADDLQAIVSGAGVTGQAVLDCVKNGTYRSWAADASRRAAASIPYAGTTTRFTTSPTVIAAGSVYEGKADDASAFTTFLGEAYTSATASASGDGTATPTPTATATPGAG